MAYPYRSRSASRPSHTPQPATAPQGSPNSSPSLQESMTATLGNDTSSGNYQPMASNDTYELDKGQFSSQPGPQMDTQGYQPIDEDYVAPGEPGYKYDNPTGPLGMNSGRNSYPKHDSGITGGAAAVGGFSPLELGVMGGAIAIPAGIAAYKLWNSGGSDPSEPRHGRPGDPPHPDDGYFKQAGDLFSGKLSDQMIGEPWTPPR